MTFREYHDKLKKEYIRKNKLLWLDIITKQADENNIGEEFLPCPYCYMEMNLVCKPGEQWKCNYCETTNNAQIFQKFSCGHYQRTFDCEHCGKAVDLDAEYDIKKIERARHDAQTELIRRKNSGG